MLDSETLIWLSIFEAEEISPGGKVGKQSCEGEKKYGQDMLNGLTQEVNERGKDDT